MVRHSRHNRGRATQPRPGMVLIELAAVIAVMSLLLAIVVTLFAGVYRLDHSWTRSTSQRRELQRLAAYVREDAHGATDVSIARDGRSWSFLLANGGRSEYEVEADAVMRAVRNSEEQPETVKRQELSLPSKAEVDIREYPFGQGRMMTLTVASGPRDDGRRAAVFRVDAHLARYSSPQLPDGE